MKDTDIFKVLANTTRLQILQWLKEPERHFPPEENLLDSLGICVGSIQRKTKLAQSTVSHYLSMLESAGFVVSTRKGQCTYYRRNESAFSDLARRVATEM
ncbi:MAG: helix-turn-helix transcriptional regulator [Oscillatoria sp. SIO1A7]|nr:helix-turn-helix transcriptional regulator [Oscillatoria sp. SIO1A7]